MLTPSIRQALNEYLQRLAGSIEIVARLDASDASREMSDALTVIADLHTSIRYREIDVASDPRPTPGVADADGGFEHRVPSFTIARQGEAPRVAFAGLPMGHEFSSLVLALLQVSGHPPKIEPGMRTRIEALPAMTFETVISLSCQNCPDVVQALNTLAVLNRGIRHTMIDGGRFPAEVESRGVMAVPSVFRDQQAFAQGHQTLEQIVARLEAQAGVVTSAAIGERQPYDMLIVGGGPAGSSAAIYAARKGIRTGMVAERFGGQVLDTLAIENYASVLHTEGPQFARALEAQVREQGVEMIGGRRVTALKPSTRPGGHVSLALENGEHLLARSVVIATGARWRELGVPGEQHYRNKGVAYCPHCDGPLFKGKRVAVAGGGNSGVEAAIDLAGIVEHVTLLEYAPELKADAVLQRKLASLANVTVITQAQTTEVVGDGQRVTGLRYTDRRDGGSHEIALAGIFVQIGLVPNTGWLAGVLERNRFGEIVIDAQGRTSVPGVFAAGDVTTVPYKQIVIATGEGARSALSAFEYLIRQGDDETAAVPEASADQQRLAA
ncbi:MAG: alkyl hydroperoxide reductase subunit F [Burkholderiaceae bacterium]